MKLTQRQLQWAMMMPGALVSSIPSTWQCHSTFLHGFHVLGMDSGGVMCTTCAQIIFSFCLNSSEELFGKLSLRAVQNCPCLKNRTMGRWLSEEASLRTRFSRLSLVPLPPPSAGPEGALTIWFPSRRSASHHQRKNAFIKLVRF